MSKKYRLLLGAALMLSGCSLQPSAQPVITTQASQIKTTGIDVIQQGDRLTMVVPTDIYFDPMTSTVKEEKQKNLQQMAKFVKNFADTYPNSVIRVTGYTDRVFSSRTQLQLSQNYADAVSAYIFNAGVDSKRIATQGRGSNEPVAGEFEPSSAALNRRVVVQVN